MIREVRSYKLGVISFLILLFLISHSLVITSDYCYAQPISSNELINNAADYNNKVIVYKGEAIGDIMIRGAYAWVNVNDAEGAIGIWMPQELARNIQYTGSYKAKGDYIKITGMFHRACPQHGGDLDIHATEVTRISLGRLRVEKIVPRKRELAIIFFTILCLLLILQILQTRRGKK